VEQVEKRELLDQQIVVQVTGSTKRLVNRLYRAYGLNSEAALIRMALAQGKTLDQLAQAVALDPQ
jgi:hypothetical protein